MSRSKAASRRAKRQRQQLQARRQPVRPAGPPMRFQCASGQVAKIEAAAGDETGTKLPRFSMVAYTGGLMMPLGYDYPVVADIQGMSIPKQVNPILRDHDHKLIVGHSESVQIQGIQVLAAGTISGVSDAAQEVVGTGLNQFPWQASCGWLIPPQQLEFIAAGVQVEVNGQTFPGPCYVAHQSVIREISFVVFGGDPNTSASVSGQLNPNGVDSMDFEAWLAKNGFTMADLSPEQLAVLRTAYDTEVGSVEAADGTDDEDDENVDARAANARSGAAALNATASNGTPRGRRSAAASAQGTLDLQAMQGQVRSSAVEAIRAEQVRIDGVTRICAQFQNPKFKVNGQDVDLRAHAISEGWDLQRTELEARREARPSAPSGHAHSHEGSCTLESLSGALLLKAGVSLDNKAFAGPAGLVMNLPSWLRAGLNTDARQRTMEAAHQFRDMGMIDLCREVNRIEGRYTGYGRSEVIQAAMSGGTLNKIFTTNISAVVLETFKQIDDTTAAWTRRNTDVPNFMPQELIGMEIDGGMEKLPRGKTAKHGTMSDKGEQYKIFRYAKKITIDEQDIIDDRFDLLKDRPVQLANAAAELTPSLVYAILLSNPLMGDGKALFHTDRKNRNTGRGLSEPNLKTSITDFRTITENGVTINLTPTHLICPAALEFTADGLLTSAETMYPAATGGPTINTLRGKIRARISDARLDNGVLDPDSGELIAGSADDWFLVDSMYPPIEVGYLRGTGGLPTVRSFQLEQGAYGMGWDIKLDVGAKAIRTQSIQRNEG
ncbi:hypothetical protein SH661x_001955 [Planctomicrobium sp. SH661]|uniref:phage major capsid protein n=1 Tax=Planctomicrobium sp. SH661 TaxID=3448124 RepID=UPI003F5C058F